MLQKQASGMYLIRISYDRITNQIRIGLGQYLSNLDPQHRPWQYQIRHVIVYCVVHFTRSINKAAGTEVSPTTGHNQMHALRSAATEEEWWRIIGLLKGM